MIKYLTVRRKFIISMIEIITHYINMSDNKLNDTKYETKILEWAGRLSEIDSCIEIFEEFNK